MIEEASSKAPAIVPAPPGTQLWMTRPGEDLQTATVVAFVVDRGDYRIVEVVTSTGDKLHPTPRGYLSALVIGDRISSAGTEYASLGDFIRASSGWRPPAQPPAGVRSPSARTHGGSSTPSTKQEET